MSIPAWRQRQIDEQDTERELRANERLGVLTGMDEMSDAEIKAFRDGPLVCVVCWQSKPRADVRCSPCGNSVCTDCLPTEKGLREMTRFSSTAGYRERTRRA